VLAAASAAHEHTRLDAGLGIGLLQLRHPTGAHGVIDDAVAKCQQPQVAAFGENAACAREVLPVRGRHVELSVGHLRLDAFDLLE
jgi:hypothetical protein